MTHTAIETIRNNDDTCNVLDSILIIEKDS